jgi:hypothetical protein
VRRLRVAVVVAAMIMLSGCGHQVTGLTQTNAGLVPSGQMLIRFETAGPVDLTNSNYLIVFNTTGNNHTPFAQGSNSNFTDWSFGFLVSGSTGLANPVQAKEFYQNPTTGQAGIAYPLSYVPQQVNFNPSAVGTLSQYAFEIKFDRCVFNVQAPTGTTAPTPPPFVQGKKCPPFDFTTTSTTWTFNLFTLDRTSTVADALVTVGSGAPNPINTSTNINDYSYAKPAGGTTAQVPSQQISGVEIFNTP